MKKNNWRFLFCLLFIPCGFLFGGEKEAAAVFYIVRHGQTDWNMERRIQGHSDIPLNDTGRAQAAEVKEKLKSIGFDYCFSSDLQRAAETARILIDDRPITVQLDQRLRERNFGPWEGCLSSEYDDSLNQTGLSVESTETIQKRVLHFLQEKADLYPGSPILIATHGGAMSSLLAAHFAVSVSEIRCKNLALLQLKCAHGKIEVQDLQGIEISSIDEMRG